ncbi:MAG: 30S ribosomal protein S8 [Rhabdochlamydiaceae bacterium]|nr:30S ribosomal protein S8 [Rhabdochlamydiaceae bacterium]
MSLSDPIADLLTRIRNAASAKHRYVDARATKLLISLVKVIQKLGFVENFLINEEERKMRIFLKYAEGRESLITGLKRISRPSLRRYVGHTEIPRIYGGMGLVIISTSKGVMDGESAREQGVGGELLCFIW